MLAILLVLGLGVGYGAVASLGPLGARPGWRPASDLSEYTAVLHVHSSYSHDGRGSVEEVAAAASRAGVRVVFLTDHNTLAPRLGWRHAVPKIDGLEVIDVFDQLMAVPFGRKVMDLAAYPANPVMAVLSWIHWPRAVLARWDGMSQKSPTLGVLALDAHGGIALTEETDMVVPSHETAFRLGRLHFVTTEPLRRDAADRLRVDRAMRAGRFYNAFDGFAPAEGFRFEVRLGEDRALMGATVPFRPGQAALIEVPPVGDAIVRLLRDGTVLHEVPGDMLLRIPLPGSGVYRVEVDLRVDLFPIGGVAYRPWIFSNPVYVRG